jgi:2-phosphoglycerate kinase
MKVRRGDDAVPFPLFTLKGKLRLSGLDDQSILEVLQEATLENIDSSEGLFNHVYDSLSSFNPEIQNNFNTLVNYEKVRGKKRNIPAIILILEGASATGKSLIALELMRDLAATRFISTDSVRMVLRGIMSKEEYPELFCHTYQAYNYRQAGPKELNPVLRGFLAQCEVIAPHIETMTKGLIAEGATTVIEGVHVIPGTLQDLSQGVLEVLINPEPTTHKAMFTSKYNLEKLASVSEDKSIREKEFEATLAIQKFMLVAAEKAGTAVVDLKEYEGARALISAQIISKIEGLLKEA